MSTDVRSEASLLAELHDSRHPDATCSVGGGAAHIAVGERIAAVGQAERGDRGGGRRNRRRSWPGRSGDRRRLGGEVHETRHASAAYATAMITVAQRDYQGGLSQPRHSHDNMSVTLVLAGTIRERVGNVEEIARPLSLVVKPVDVEHENLFGPGRVRTLQILLDGRDAGQVCQANPATRRWRWIHFGLQIRPFLTLARSLRSGDSDAVELLTIDALASIDTLPTAPGGAPSILRTVRQRLDDESSPPRVRDLAAGADVHPVYLARLFRRYYGTTISHYVRRRRIRGVIARMSRPASSLSMAAHEAGFADHAHMCRTFRAETGMAPSEYRLIIT